MEKLPDCLERPISRSKWEGSHNDINVLHRSPVFDDVLEGRVPDSNFVVNDNHYDKVYYLTDGIYPQWATFIQSITLPQTPKEKLFAKHQEAARKDVERAFGVLQARFAIICKPSLAWNRDVIRKIMMACIIMHNIIVEDERDTYDGYDNPQEFMEDNYANKPQRRASKTGRRKKLKQAVC
ncbi:putative nuclease HARBI1 [Impatiens glandulifera]|uniref:putative nuclease HARBI1 n=1 Tax=Impatiens glandulifera TaxID=253017 RepID=UPI001FB0FB39|nr:putative nuclease HARBI1 [Impatiens glandulifera]